MPTRFDHIVVGAASLAQGAQYVEAELGVHIPEGGEHPNMGTHNCLMQLGDGGFLEVIAPNPEGSAPEQPRWFGLDDPFVQAALNEEPRLLTWVVSTSDLARSLSQSAFPFGEASPMRRGDLRWRFGLPEDGRLLAGGLAPYLIEWPADGSPAGDMADMECRLEVLELHHPYPAWLSRVLASIGADECAEVNATETHCAPFMRARIDTPAGPRVLSSRTT